MDHHHSDSPLLLWRLWFRVAAAMAAATIVVAMAVATAEAVVAK